MAYIIDLDFYRKFRVILPLEASEETRHKKTSPVGVKPCRRRKATSVVQPQEKDQEERKTP